jgi:hypothetical protein
VDAEPLDTELLPEDPTVVESEPDALHVETSISAVPTPAIVVEAQEPEVQEDATVIPEAESDLPSHEIKTEFSSSDEEGDATQDSSPFKGFVDNEVQLEAQELEETINADSGVAAANVLPEALLSTVASESEFIVSNEGQLRLAMEVHSTNSQLESAVEPVEVLLDEPEARESDRIAEAEPLIIPAIVEESPVQIEEDTPVLAALQVRQLLSSHS